jgi:hypothetical protein
MMDAAYLPCYEICENVMCWRDDSLVHMWKTRSLEAKVWMNYGQFAGIL